MLTARVAIVAALLFAAVAATPAAAAGTQTTGCLDDVGLGTTVDLRALGGDPVGTTDATRIGPGPGNLGYPEAPRYLQPDYSDDEGRPTGRLR